MLPYGVHRCGGFLWLSLCLSHDVRRAPIVRPHGDGACARIEVGFHSAVCVLHGAFTVFSHSAFIFSHGVLGGLVGYPRAY